MNRRVAMACEVKGKTRSRSESESEEGEEYVVADPKPGDLPVSRVKAG
jgi:hypothetical protein